jgi:hypothetical protein
MVVSKSSKVDQDVFSIKDPLNILITILVFVILLFVTYLSVLGLFDGVVLFFVVSASLLLAVGYRLKAIWDGVELDLNTREMSFPGGGIEANEITDYISLDYLLQLFKRKTIDLDDISEISQETIQTTRRKDGKTQISYTHYIKFVGAFGAAKVRFQSEGKRDQLYNAIRQANRMGAPIFEA